MIGPGVTVDLYYYGEANTVRSLTCTITDASETWLIVTDDFGMPQAFPLTSIQRLIPSY